MARIQRFPRLKHPKINGSTLAEFCGLTIYGILKKAKIDLDTAEQALIRHLPFDTRRGSRIPSAN